MRGASRAMDPAPRRTDRVSRPSQLDDTRGGFLQPVGNLDRHCRVTPNGARDRGPRPTPSTGDSLAAYTPVITSASARAST